MAWDFEHPYCLFPNQPLQHLVTSEHVLLSPFLLVADIVPSPLANGEGCVKQWWGWPAKSCIKCTLHSPREPPQVTSTLRGQESPTKWFACGSEDCCPYRTQQLAVVLVGRRVCCIHICDQGFSHRLGPDEGLRAGF